MGNLVDYAKDELKRIGIIDSGEVWYMSGESRVNVTFPYIVPDKPEYVYRNKEDKE